MKIELRLGLTGSSSADILRRVCDLGVVGSGLPEELDVDNRERKVTADWIDKWLPKAKSKITARWKGGRDFVSYSIQDGMTKVIKSDFEIELPDFSALLAQIPFTLCSTGTLHAVWGEEITGEEYLPYGFGGLHYGFGWGCAFKGEGHRYLLSRRVLDFGPWRVIRGEDDVSLVQFHDMEAPVLEALEQAKPGHRFMSLHFIQPFYTYVPEHELGGLYDPDERKFKIIVNGRAVPMSEMEDACATRLYQVFGADQPIDNVAYMFAIEDEARAHLHELWLCGLECWTFEGGRERRLDIDYHPTPVKPDWVKRLEDQTGR